MKGRRGGKRKSLPDRPKSGGASPPVAAKSGTHAAPHSSRILLDVFVGLLITGLLSVANWGIEKTTFGEEMRESMYDILQLRLTSKFDANKLDVAVVDTSTIPYDRAFSHDYDFTNRAQLTRVVQDIALKQEPRAIAVDVDFTPYPDQMAADDGFLSACLKLTQSAGGKPGVPVYVAAFRSLLLGPAMALYSGDYQSLAAYDGLPQVAENETPKRMVDRVDVRYEDDKGETQTWKLRSLSASATGYDVQKPPSWIGWAIDRQIVVPRNGFTATEFYVDYSPLDALIAQTIPWDDPRIAESSGELAGKIVFVGRAKLAAAGSDRHVLPGHRGKPFAGVYIHACAAYTLLHGPLQKLTLKARYALDLLLGLFTLIPVALLRWRYRATEPYGGIAHHRLSNLLTLATVCVAIAAGVYAVNVHRLMWDDSIFVAAGLLIHRTVERHLVAITMLGKRLVTLGWVLLLFKEDEDVYRPLDEENAEIEGRAISAPRGVVAIAAVVAAGAMFLGAPRVARAQQTAFAGMVKDVNCAGELIEPGSQEKKALLVGRSGNRPLIDGERLHCSGPGSMTIVSGDGRKTISNADGWITVHPGKILQEMTDYSEQASTRGGSVRETIFMSPPEDGAIEPEKFELRWNAANVKGEVTLTLVTQSNRELWRQSGFPGETGRLASDDLRRALTAYRERGATAPLVIRIADAAGNAYEVSFSVLTPPDEETLQQMLAEWDTRDPLVRELGRASTYSAFGLYVEAAQEYETALRVAPNSFLLLQLAATAERRTGNSARADELSQKLARAVAKSG